MTKKEIKILVNLLENKIQEHENFDDCEYNTFEYITDLRNIADKLEKQL